MLNIDPDSLRPTNFVVMERLQAQLAALAESWEPGASASPPARRLSKCAACARRMWFPWHFWLAEGGFKKELHVCNHCVRKRGWA